jgi:glycosyltransferase involved in cell wall biosynthesis
VLFFAAGWIDDPRKGMRYLIEALRQLRELIVQTGNIDGDEILLLVAGHNDNSIHSQLPFPFKSLGYIEDDKTLAMAYQAADAFVCSSIEEAGPMMIPESMLCGTPVVAFNTGGAIDLIVTMKTGYVAKCGDSSDLAQGIFKILAAENISVLREAARKAAVRKHSVQNVLDNYLRMFSLLAKPGDQSIH